MSVSLTGRAGVHYRTRLLTQERALSFARALEANRRFEEVSVTRSGRARSDAQFFVTFRPVSEQRMTALREEQQDARDARAIEEGSAYLWCRDENCGRSFVWCLSTSGEVYEVTPGKSCTCPDFEYRAGPSGLHCKHLQALFFGLGTMTDFQPVPSSEEEVTR